MIPIRIHPFFFLLALLLGFYMSDGDWSLTFFIALIIALSVLVHELGHALCGLAFHQKVSINLLPFGGLTERQGRPLKAWQDFLIVLMGPLFGYMLYFGAATLLRHYPAGLPGTLLIFTAVINWYWTLLNLIPVMPLDGGQLMRIALQGIWGIKGLKAACLLSVIVGALSMVYGLLRQDIWLVAIFGIFTYESWRTYHEVQFLKDQDTDVTLQRLLAKGEKAYEKGEYEKSREIFLELRRQAKAGTLFNMATLRLAEAALAHENPVEGYDLLEPIKRELSIDGLALFQEVAFRTAHWQDALDAGIQVSKVAPSADLAFQNAAAAANLGDTTAEAGWMKSYHNLKPQN